LHKRKEKKRRREKLGANAGHESTGKQDATHAQRHRSLLEKGSGGKKDNGRMPRATLGQGKRHQRIESSLENKRRHRENHDRRRAQVLKAEIREEVVTAGGGHVAVMRLWNMRLLEYLSRGGLAIVL